MCVTHYELQENRDHTHALTLEASHLGLVGVPSDEQDLSPPFLDEKSVRERVTVSNDSKYVTA